MTTTTTEAPAGPLAGLAAELQRQLATKRDLMADTRRVTLAEPEGDPGGTCVLVDLDTGVEELAVTPHAHGQIATHLGVPAKLYGRLLDSHPDLLAGLANGLLAREPHKRMLRTMDGRLRAFLSNGYRPRDNWDLLDQAILPALAAHPGTVQFKACELTETNMYVKVVLPDFEMPVTPTVGDAIRGGLIVKNSEVGAGSLGIYPYTDRLSCLNGAIHTDYGQAQRHVGKRIDVADAAYEFYSDETLALDDAAFFAKCADTVRAVLNEQAFEAIVGQMRDLAGIRLDAGPVDAVEIVGKRHDLGEGERQSMLKALVENGDLSLWGMVNAVTQTARDLDNPDRRVELEALAGRMVADPELVAA